MHFWPAYIKRFAALALLGIFGFIQSEKCLHGHSSLTKHQHDHTSLSGTNLNCLLCEYQLVTDADLPEDEPLITALSYAPDKNPFVSVFYFSAQPAALALRGPPSYC